MPRYNGTNYGPNHGYDDYHTHLYDSEATAREEPSNFSFNGHRDNDARNAHRFSKFLPPPPIDQCVFAYNPDSDAWNLAFYSGPTYQNGDAAITFFQNTRVFQRIPQRNIFPIEEFVTCIRKEKYEEGYSHGDQHGFQVGKRVAEAEFQQALQAGIKKGYQQGRQVAEAELQQAFQTGIKKGYEQGRQVAEAELKQAFQAGSTQCYQKVRQVAYAEI
jgi:hypothetical protein